MQKRKALLTAPLACLVVLTLLFGSPTSIVHVQAAGFFDSDGNKNGIISLFVDQNISGSWETKKYIVFTTYNPSTGFAAEIETDVETKFIIRIGINKTHASTSQEAQDNTRVNFTLIGSGGVGTIYNNMTMAWYSTIDETTYYAVVYDYIWNTTLPQSGITYTAYFRYYIYY